MSPVEVIGCGCGIFWLEGNSFWPFPITRRPSLLCVLMEAVSVCSQVDWTSQCNCLVHAEVKSCILQASEGVQCTRLSSGSQYELPSTHTQHGYVGKGCGLTMPGVELSSLSSLQIVI